MSISELSEYLVQKLGPPRQQLARRKQQSENEDENEHTNYCLFEKPWFINTRYREAWRSLS